MYNGFRGTIANWARRRNIYTTIGKSGLNLDAIVVALPKEALHLRDGNSLPNPFTFKWAHLIVFTFHANQPIGLFKLKSHTQG